MTRLAPTFCIVDIETDGPDPQRHSMRSLAVVACDDDGREVGTFVATVEALPDATTSEATMAWWATQPDAWAEATRAPRPAGDVVAGLVAWLRALPAPRVFVAHPLAFDGAWVDAYLRRFTDARVFDPDADDPLFDGAGVDLGSHVAATFDLPWRARPYPYPEALLGGHVHDHTALSDARGHASLFFRSRSLARDPATRDILRRQMLAATRSG